MNREKLCISCNRVKPIDDYYMHPTNSDNHQRICAECDKARQREYYIENKARIDRARKAWQAENYERHIEHCKKYVENRNNKQNKSIY